ncbi:hypothetical protein OESDEN_04642 [Oesophagostomum dentatum]|uniref:Serine carboxypeptidase S28 n=1 Tax=Oesophagostomum dentatum TaxID=61180 RepID=A0A0B1TCW9_OESDE|nr:hypothetical protein OESDEN_04642 [Oesophagostomum dentatum]
MDLHIIEIMQEYYGNLYKCHFLRNICSLFTRMCTDLYGSQYTAAAVQKSINRINEFYGGIDFYNGTNVVMLNGSIDPWHALGKYTSTDASAVSRLIKGTAHCADMYPARKEDLPDLVAARKLIEENITKWLKGTETTTMPKPTTRTTGHRTTSRSATSPASKPTLQPTSESTRHITTAKPSTQHITTAKPPEPVTSRSTVEQPTTSVPPNSSSVSETTTQSGLSKSLIGFTIILYFLTTLMLSFW